MMKGIYFDGVHSYKDLNLVLSSVSIPPPAVKTNYVNIPGADGQLDLTEALGEVNYKDRDCSFTFTVFPYENFEDKKTQITNLLHGKRCKIILDKDPEYYWEGRCSVKSYASDRNLHKIVVGATVAPYKMKKEQTDVFVPFCGKNLLYMPSAKTVASEGVTWELTDAGRIIASGTPTAYSALAIYLYTDGFILGKGTYTISYSGVCKNVNVDVAITKADGTKVTIVNSKPMPVTFSMAETTGVYLAVKRRLNGATINMDCVLQIEQGSKATDYEPYTPSTDPVELTLTNSRKSVVPTIKCTGDTTITVGGSEYELSEGTHKVLDIQLHEGETPVILTGSGSVSLIYQEGDL